MRLPRGGDHATGVALSRVFDPGPAFFRDPRRGCAPGKVDPNVFFQKDAGPAKKICRRCPFRQRCDTWAVAHHVQWGVWGGRCRNPRLSRRFEEDMDRGEDS